jgi:hypothetical protein
MGAGRGERGLVRNERRALVIEFTDIERAK